MIPLFALFTREVVKLFILMQIIVLSNDEHSTIGADTISSIWLALQLVFSPISGLISDKTSRKITLAVTILSSLATILLLKWSFLWPAIIFDGIFGNTTSIARAAYLDIRASHNKALKKMPVIIYSLMSQVVAWIIICSNSLFFYDYLFYISLIFNIISSVIVCLFFKDSFDLKGNPDLNEIKHVMWKFCTWPFFRLICAFIFLAIGFQIMTYFAEGNLEKKELRIAYLFLNIGLLGGLIMQRIYNFKPHFRVIHLISVSSLTLVFIEWLGPYVLSSKPTFTLTLFLAVSFLAGIYWPSIYAAFADHSKEHELGLIFGLLESIGNLAEFIAPLLLTLTAINHKLNFFPFMILFFIASILTIGKQGKTRSSEIR